ncbi:hypothetical protein [Streptomyces alanosinicus]|uniref:hypothetical protein n=1 Tax=Streptomyces alanosinicus TaxID=68171 RepID=UPI001675FCB8|nr:hypothetical protein [Streptomyces alanosinicus]
MDVFVEILDGDEAVAVQLRGAVAQAADHRRGEHGRLGRDFAAVPDVTLALVGELQGRGSGQDDSAVARERLRHIDRGRADVSAQGVHGERAAVAAVQEDDDAAGAARAHPVAEHFRGPGR